MGKTVSPLRYPGGKYKIYSKVKSLIEFAGLENRTYVEPFAGGFGIGIGLLQDGIVQSAVINDYDPHIYHFWHAAIYQTEALITLIQDTPITLDEREQQKVLYDDPMTDSLHDGFATLFLNRVNYSGVIKGGPIGGAEQTGDYKLGCRFSKEETIKRIRSVAGFRDNIALYNEDASHLISETLRDTKNHSFFNIDPPYVVKGSQLYTNFFVEQDHRNLEQVISSQLQDIPWVVTYDNSELIRNIYKDYHMEEYIILHNAGSKSKNKELVITNLPFDRFVW